MLRDLVKYCFSYCSSITSLPVFCLIYCCKLKISQHIFKKLKHCEIDKKKIKPIIQPVIWDGKCKTNITGITKVTILRHNIKNHNILCEYCNLFFMSKLKISFHTRFYSNLQGHRKVSSVASCSVYSIWDNLVLMFSISSVCSFAHSKIRPVEPISRQFLSFKENSSFLHSSSLIKKVEMEKQVKE